MTEKPQKEKSLYWSSYDLYVHCNQAFLWTYGDAEIDLGAGLGKPKPGAMPSSRHDSIMGQAIQFAVERLYNDYLWQRLLLTNPEERWTPQRLVEHLKKTVLDDFRHRLNSEYIDWTWAPSQLEMERICLAGLIGFLKTMKANHFIGVPAIAEKKFVAYLDDVPLAARVDLFFQREAHLPLPGVTILDGKNSQTKGKYTNPDQLRFYALVYLLSTGKLPDRVGFTYYRFPYGTVLEDGTIDSGVDWVPLHKEDIRGLAHKVKAAREGIRAKQFDANPVPSYCKWCKYEDLCKPRQAQKASNREKRRPKEGAKSKKKKDDITFPEPDEFGFSEIG